jgi:hypothetical protein
MVDQNIVNYVKSSLSQGHSPDSVRQALASQGWDEGSINQAFAAAQGGAAPQGQAAPAPQGQPAAVQGAAQPGKRTTGVTIICILGFLVSALGIVTGVAGLLLGSLFGALGSVTGGTAEADLGSAFGALGSFVMLISITSMVIGIVAFIAFFMLLKMKKIGWWMVIILGLISIAIPFLQLNVDVIIGNVLTFVIWGVIIVYLVLKKNLFV